MFIDGLTHMNQTTPGSIPIHGWSGVLLGAAETIRHQKGVDLCDFLYYYQTILIDGLNTMKKKPASTLRKRRQALLRQLPPLDAILRGSLLTRYKPCGKPGCKCAHGRGHGPKYYLSVTYPRRRKPQVDYVPQGACAQAAQFLANYHRARKILEEICEINQELLRRREAL
jgi:hypothetical protein